MWRGVMIHHSASPDRPEVDAKAFRAWHRQRGWRDLGYHFVAELIGNEPEILAGRPLWMAGSHCVGYNRTHLGFCIAGDFTSEPPSEALLRLAASHVAGLRWLLDAYRELAVVRLSTRQFLDDDLILYHSDKAPTLCPGAMFPRAEFERLVSYYLAKREI